MSNNSGYPNRSKHVSLDDVPNLDLVSSQQVVFGSSKSKDLFGEMFQQNFATIYRQFLMLPLVDQQLYQLYYINNLSQWHIKTILEVSQSAIGRRLFSIREKLRFLLRMPTLNPIQARRDLKLLLGDDLWETAFFYYWECNQNRVSNILETTPSGASYRLERILKQLQNLADSEEDSEVSERKYLALSYLDYFRFIKSRANIINFFFKKKEMVERDAIQTTRSVFEP